MIALLSVTMPYTVLVVPIRLSPVMGFVLMLLVVDWYGCVGLCGPSKGFNTLIA